MGRKPESSNRVSGERRGAIAWLGGTIRRSRGGEGGRQSCIDVPDLGADSQREDRAGHLHTDRQGEHRGFNRPAGEECPAIPGSREVQKSGDAMAAGKPLCSRRINRLVSGTDQLCTIYRAAKLAREGMSGSPACGRRGTVLTSGIEPGNQVLNL